MADLEKRIAPVLAEVVPIGWRSIAPTFVREGDCVMWRKGRTWHRVIHVDVCADVATIVTRYKRQETRGTTLLVKRAIREHLPTPRWMRP